MRAYIITTIMGSFGVNEKNQIISFRPFTKTPEEVAEKIKFSEIEVIKEEKMLMQELWKKGYKDFIFPFRKQGVRHSEPGSKAEEFIKENLRKLAIDKNFVKDQTEFNRFLTQVNLQIAKVKIKKAVERDSFIIQTSGAIDELDKSINVLIERLREFYSLHFPEMDRTISNHERYAKIIEKYGSREKIEEPELKQLVEKSMGADFSEDDIKAVQTIATEILSLYKMREDLSKYMEKLLKDVAPNFTELAGPLLSAKIISKAGGLEKLARMPSSTVQLLGSEKALFRFLHGHGRSPRFGLIFNHQLIQKAPENLKGRVARVLASKLSIAAKMDFYSKEYKGDKLKNELEERVKEILKNK